MNPLKKYEKLLITPRDQVKANPAKVGQAVYDILSKTQHTQTVEETIEGMKDRYFEKLLAAVEEGCQAKNYPSVFYVLIERKKETLMGNANNVLSQRYFTLPFKPRAKTVKEERPNSDFDLYEANKDKCEITHIWTLPTYQDSVTVLKNKQMYDPQYVKWIEDYNAGILDRAS